MDGVVDWRESRMPVLWSRPLGHMGDWGAELGDSAPGAPATAVSLYRLCWGGVCDGGVATAVSGLLSGEQLPGPAHRWDLEGSQFGRSGR